MRKSYASFGKSLAVCLQTFQYLRLSSREGASLNLLKKQWASDTLDEIGLKARVIGEISRDRSVLFVGNHLSYIDIVLLMRYVYGISFVAKKEIEDWPLFGHGARAIGTIFVKRENAENRGLARIAIAEALREGKRVAVFPSGTTCMNESKDWRRGAFEIARDEKVKIQPFRLTYSPLRTAAFIDDDALLPHMSRLIRTPNMTATLEFHPLIEVTDAEEARLYCQDWSRRRDLESRMPAFG